MVDTLIIKYDPVDQRNDLIEDQTYEIQIDYTKCAQIISLNQGVLHDGYDDYIKSIDGKKIQAIYKGKSRIDNMDIFLISPLQINRQIKIDQIL